MCDVSLKSAVNFQFASAFKDEKFNKVKEDLQNKISDSKLDSGEIEQVKKEFESTYKNVHSGSTDTDAEKAFYSAMENIVGLKGIDALKSAKTNPVEFYFEIKNKKVLVSGGEIGKDDNQVANYFEVNPNQMPKHDDFYQQIFAGSLPEEKNTDDYKVSGSGEKASVEMKSPENKKLAIEFQESIGMENVDGKIGLKTLEKFREVYITAIKKGDAAAITKLDNFADKLLIMFDGSDLGKNIKMLKNIATEKDKSLEMADQVELLINQCDIKRARELIQLIPNEDLRASLTEKYK